MEKGWKQTWKNLLFQHYEITNIKAFEKYLPKNCSFDSFEGKYYLGLVAMNMTNVRHKATGGFVWFKNYNELNVRTYILHEGKPGVLFLSLDVNSFISFFGARVFYGLPYRLSSYKTNDDDNSVKSFRNGKLQFQTKYELVTKSKKYEKPSFAYWATERYFFANKYLGVSFKGEISHKPWQLCIAKAFNKNLEVLQKYPIGKQHEDTIFCKEIEVVTNKLKLIK